jgi:nitrate reductase gamma subunit
MIGQLIDRLLGLLVGLGLITIGSLIAAEATLAILGRPAWRFDPTQILLEAQQVRLSELVTGSTLAVLTLIALLVLWLARPRPGPLIRLRPAADARAAYLERRSVARRISRALERDAEIAAANVTIGWWRARARLTLHPGVTNEQVMRRVKTIVRTELAGLELRGRRYVSVSRKRASGRVG